jgi:hypothetical protein
VLDRVLTFTVWLTTEIVAQQPSTAPPSGLVPTLLTGGGFAFLGIVIAGLFMVNKNKAESANTVAQGAATWAKGLSEELTAYKHWAGRRRVADREHTLWDDDMVDQFRELIRKCEEAKIIEPGSIKLEHPPSLEVPFIDPYTDPHLEARKP